MTGYEQLLFEKSHCTQKSSPVKRQQPLNEPVKMSSTQEGNETPDNEDESEGDNEDEKTAAFAQMREICQMCQGAQQGSLREGRRKPALEKMQELGWGIGKLGW